MRTRAGKNIERVLSRREFLSAAALPALGLVAAACAPAPAEVPAAAGQSAKAKWEADWENLMAAARSEGTLSVFTTAGEGNRKWMDAVGVALGLSIEHQMLPSSDLLVPKITQERQAGIYTFDVLITSPVIALPRLRPAGVLDDLRAVLFRPDVLDDKAWTGGFEDGWLDSKKSLGYAQTDFVSSLAVNTDLVNENDLKSARDLLDPKWKGKMIWQDVRSGSTYVLFTSIRLRLGDDAVKRLVIDQEPVFSRDTRQIREGIVRGRYAIGNSVTPQLLQGFLDAGAGKAVKLIDVPDATYISRPFAVWLANKAPHPNAAKLFVNWVLTKEGQHIYSTNTGVNTRRTDVPPVDPASAPRPGQYYFNSGAEDAQPDLDKTQAMLNDLLGIKN